MAIPNLYQSFWGKLLEKIENSHFWPFQIDSSLFGKNYWKKFRMAIFGHSKFIPVILGKIVGKKFRTSIFGHSKFIAIFLGKIVGKNSEHPFLAIPNLYQSLWEKLLEKNQNGHFWPFQIYTSCSGKNCWKKLRTAIFGHSKCIPVFLGKLLEKNQNSHFLPFQIYTNLFGKNCQKKLRTAIFGHSKFIPVCLGKIVGKDLEQPFLAIPN